ncbi:subtilisin-like protein [Backusella circina FSU 941]|nr:subtilisin-like protein [Backusella circina FSU 941]
MANAEATLSGFEQDSVKNIHISGDVNFVVGSFNPSFAGYLNSLDDIDYVEPNRIYKAPFMPLSSASKPAVSRVVPSRRQKSIKKYQKREMITQSGVPSWGICRINQRERGDLASYTSDTSAGQGIDVYIFDTGINAEHPDFGGRAVRSENFIDYEDNIDYAGHGTHVAGTIGGMTYGIAKNVQLHGVKILDKNGDGSTATLIEVFVSAGNTGDNACDYSPSANPDVFTVGASDLQDAIPSFSSYGECVRIYAPGTNITSTWMNDQSQTMDGTSMANPHVTGIAAMLMSERNFDSANDLYNTIIQIATPGVLKSPVEQTNLLLAYNGLER